MASKVLLTICFNCHVISWANFNLCQCILAQWLLQFILLVWLPFIRNDLVVERQIVSNFWRIWNDYEHSLESIFILTTKRWKNCCDLWRNKNCIKCRYPPLKLAAFAKAYQLNLIGKIIWRKIGNTHVYINRQRDIISKRKKNLRSLCLFRFL